MTFDQFHQNHPELTFLLAKIQYNLEQSKKQQLIISFSNEDNYGACESCSA